MARIRDSSDQVAFFFCAGDGPDRDRWHSSVAGLEYYDARLNQFRPALVARFGMFEADLHSLAAGCRRALEAMEPRLEFTQVADPVLTLRVNGGSMRLPTPGIFEATIDLRAAFPPERATPCGRRRGLSDDQGGRRASSGVPHRDLR